MSAENPALPNDFAIQPVEQDEKALDKMLESKWLPRIQLMDKSHELVVEDKIKQGAWAMFKSGTKSFDDLGPSFEAYVFAMRAKAMRFGGKEGIYSSFDPSSAAFKEIEGQSDVRDSGCAAGVEFLVWIRSNRTFATWFASNKTARRSALDLKNILRAWRADPSKEPRVKFAGSVKSNTNYKWWGPDFFPASAPFSESPDIEEVKEQVGRFVSPPKDEREPIEANSESRER